MDTQWVKNHGGWPFCRYTMGKLAWWMPFLWIHDGLSKMVDALLVDTRWTKHYDGCPSRGYTMGKVSW